MRILIATDGSDFSKAAIEKCCEMIIKPENAVIKIVSVFEQLAPLAAEPFAVSAEYYQELENAARRQAEEYAVQAVSVIQNRFPDAGGDLTTRVEMGSPGMIIVEIAQQWKADLIVLGSHGRGFWERMMIGSVSDSVVHHAPCSVLVVRKQE